MPPIRGEYLTRDRSPRALRRFGFFFAALLLACAFLLGRRSAIAGWILAGFAVATIVAAEVRPHALNRLHRSWSYVAIVLGFIVPPALLVVTYYFVITPVGLLQRVVRSRGIDRRFRTADASYWKPRKTGGLPAGYERQF